MAHGCRELHPTFRREKLCRRKENFKSKARFREQAYSRLLVGSHAIQPEESVKEGTLKIYAASLLATQHDTQEVEHHLFTFSLRNDAELTPEQNAMEIARGLLPNGELFDCKTKVVAVDLARHFGAIKFEESKEA
jgi:hypothetical protein